MAWLNAFQQPSTYPENSIQFPCFPKRLRPFGWLVTLGIIQGIAQGAIQGLLAEPGQAAEQIVIHYGSFNGAVALDDLEASWQVSQASPERSRFMPMPPEAAARLQALLTQPLPFLPPEQTDNLFRSPSGEVLLGAVAEVFLVTESREQGLSDLRAALVGAAASGNAVTGLNVLRHFPGDIHWDARRTMALLQRQRQLNQQTGNFLALLDQSLEHQLETSASQDKARETGKPWKQEDLRLRGRGSYRQAALELWDPQRDRRFTAQLYLPEQDLPERGHLELGAGEQSPQQSPQQLPWQLLQPPSKSFMGKRAGEAIADTSAANQLAQPPGNTVPLMVMSHGLAANQRSRRFLAEHLASHGIAVAMVQHPGSDSEQFRGLLEGRADDAASARSFLDRPQDISFLLDELERLSRGTAREPGLGDDREDEHDDDRRRLVNYPLNLEQVAIFGHSFGAYTALALAGAEINFAQLRKDCEPEAMLLDLSLVLQCQALQLASAPVPILQDERVAALMLADPVSRSIFGPKELQKVELPVVWMGGQRDRFTPFRLSQLPSFHWLGSEEKYLVVAEGTSHVYLQPQEHATVNGATSVNLTERVASQPQAVQDYTNALGLAFAQAYLHRDKRYQAYFSAPYVQQLSQAPYHLRFWSPDNVMVQQSLAQLGSL